MGDENKKLKAELEALKAVKSSAPACEGGLREALKYAQKVIDELYEGSPGDYSRIKPCIDKALQTPSSCECGKEYSDYRKWAEPMIEYQQDQIESLEAERDTLASLNSVAIRLYNAGYGAGHHDTVEGRYTDIHHNDMDTYHAEEVGELEAQLKEELSKCSSIAIGIEHRLGTELEIVKRKNKELEAESRELKKVIEIKDGRIASLSNAFDKLKNTVIKDIQSLFYEVKYGRSTERD